MQLLFHRNERAYAHFGVQNAMLKTLCHVMPGSRELEGNSLYTSAPSHKQNTVKMPKMLALTAQKGRKPIAKCKTQKIQLLFQAPPPTFFSICVYGEESA